MCRSSNTQRCARRFAEDNARAESSVVVRRSSSRTLQGLWRHQRWQRIALLKLSGTATMFFSYVMLCPQFGERDSACSARNVPVLCLAPERRGFFSLTRRSKSGVSQGPPFKLQCPSLEDDGTSVR